MEVYLNKQHSDMLSSVSLHKILTFRFSVAIPGERRRIGTLTMVELDTKHEKSVIPAVVPCFDRCEGKAQPDVLLSLGSLWRLVLVLWPLLKFKRSNTGNCWHGVKKKEWLLEHPVGMSRTYKKQRGIWAGVENENQILCSVVTLFSFFFSLAVSSLCSCWLTDLVVAFKTPMT